MLNQVLDVTLAVMILLLAMSVTVIARVESAPGGTAQPDGDGEQAPQPGWRPAEPPQGLWPLTLPAGQGASLPAPRKAGVIGRGRYEARHVRGRIPKPRTPGPAGPPWGPAPPPGLPQQGSESWV
jgi:hypothetical protein